MCKCITVSLYQAALEEGEKLQLSLREALSHQQFLVACLKAGEANRLERDSSETLQAAVTQSSTLTKILNVRWKHTLPAPYIVLIIMLHVMLCCFVIMAYE